MYGLKASSLMMLIVIEHVVVFQAVLVPVVVHNLKVSDNLVKIIRFLTK